MSARHTPGEWTVKWSKYDEGVLIVQAGMPTNRVLARFDGDGDGPDEQSIADAHLIAASPRMLEALKHAQLNMSHPDQLIDDAIAEAEGKS